MKSLSTLMATSVLALAASSASTQTIAGDNQMLRQQGCFNSSVDALFDDHSASGWSGC